MADIGHAVLLHRFLKLRNLCVPVHQRKGQVIFATPEKGRWVIRRYIVRHIHIVIPLCKHTGIQQDPIARFQFPECIYRIAQQQSAGLWQAVVPVSHCIRPEQTGDLSAGRVSDHRILLRLHIKLLCMCGDILHCPRHIFHGCVAACPYPDTVAQHKRSIAHLVHLPRRRYALTDLGAGDQGISTQHQCIFPVFPFSLRRKIV